ncbi:hypothetical protein AN958_11685 [Leucoagaricus sp. SymC.cos]|nr:hypothetical protein AN958_11685 [Leucoagaricus sp. SymC.cos]
MKKRHQLPIIIITSVINARIEVCTAGKLLSPLSSSFFSARAYSGKSVCLMASDDIKVPALPQSVSTVEALLLALLVATPNLLPVLSDLMIHELSPRAHQRDWRLLPLRFKFSTRSLPHIETTSCTRMPGILPEHRDQTATCTYRQ